jgi:putative transposase|tara:strand:- start:102 stop:368 length:267 start_codon:yes stop_codon:yes gene_type:complete
MKRKQYSEEQIISILKEAEAGAIVADVIRKHGIADGTYYRWKAKYGGMEVSDAKRLKQMEEENRRLKRIVADQALDIQMLKDVNSKNW